MTEMISKEQIKNIWGFSKDIGVDKDNLYCMIERISKKDSMRKMTKLQANRLIRELIVMKDNNKKVKNRSSKKRTDIGGNKSTQLQRKKIYSLTAILGWNDNNNRINGFVKRMFKVDRIEWLSEDDCSKLIEILKQMIIRQGKEKELED